MNPSKWWRHGRTVILTCLALTLIDAMEYSIFPAQTAGEPSGSFWEISCKAFGFWFVLALLFPFVWTLSVKYPLGDANRWRHALLHCVVATVFAILFLCGGALFQFGLGITHERFIPFISRLLRHFFSLSFLVYWGMVAAAQAVINSGRAKQSDLRNAKLSADLAQIQLQALRSRLNPHFLFNSLNCISALAATQSTDMVVEAVGRLSQLLRRCLDDEEILTVPLKVELEFIEDYLAIERLRFPDRLRATVTADPQAITAMVPSMLLQPLVENAVQHGIAHAPGLAHIAVFAKRRDSELVIQIRDTGPGFDSGSLRHTPGRGIGLRATKERLNLLYGDKALIDCGNGPFAGALVSISIPFEPVPCSS